MREEDVPGQPAGGVRLATPVLASERMAGLLQRITEEGGFAYVSSVEKAAGGDFRAAEAAREMAWEQLHSGPWHSVVPAWRDAYAMSCLHVAAFHAGAGNFPEAVRALDMGLIMGGLLLQRDLDEAVEKIGGRSKGEEARVGVPGSGLRLDDGDRDGWGESQFGYSGEPIHETLCNGGLTIPCVRATNLEDAVNHARCIAQHGDTVILSPGCASFDEFKNFEHRGMVFQELALSMQKGNTQPFMGSRT